MKPVHMAASPPICVGKHWPHPVYQKLCTPKSREWKGLPMLHTGDISEVTCPKCLKKIAEDAERRLNVDQDRNDAL